MWITVLESMDILRHLSRKSCSEDSSLFSSLLQNKVSSLVEIQGHFRQLNPSLRRPDVGLVCLTPRRKLITFQVNVPLTMSYY